MTTLLPKQLIQRLGEHGLRVSESGIFSDCVTLTIHQTPATNTRKTEEKLEEAVRSYENQREDRLVAAQENAKRIMAILREDVSSDLWLDLLYSLCDILLKE